MQIKKYRFIYEIHHYMDFDYVTVFLIRQQVLANKFTYFQPVAKHDFCSVFYCLISNTIKLPHIKSKV